MVVTQPRLPCCKLGVRFGRPDMVGRFLASRRTGFYCAVVREGPVAAGDPITLIACNLGRVRVADLTRVYAVERDDVTTLRKMVALPALPGDWRGPTSPSASRRPTPGSALRSRRLPVPGPP